MVKINISEFVEYDKDSLREYLELQDETEYEIVLPREFWEPLDDDVYLIAIEFILIAYAGELLSKAVNKFSYTVPDPYTESPVKFLVEEGDPDELLDTLFEIIQGFFEHDDREAEYTKFSETAEALYKKFSDDGLVPAACGLWAVAFRLLEEPGFEEDKGEEKTDEDPDGGEEE